MPFKTPTLPELCELARQGFRNELPGTDAWLWPNNINVSAKVVGGMTHLNMVWLAYIAKQRWVSTADGEFLDKHGYVYGVPRLAAAYARGEVTFSGTSGAVIPAGLKMQRADGVGYTVTTGATVDGGGSVTLGVTADEAGAGGNAEPGTGVSLIAAYGSLTSTGVVAAAGIGLGADEEGDESFSSATLVALADAAAWWCSP